MKQFGFVLTVALMLAAFGCRTSTIIAEANPPNRDTALDSASDTPPASDAPTDLPSESDSDLPPDSETPPDSEMPSDSETPPDSETPSDSEPDSESLSFDCTGSSAVSGDTNRTVQVGDDTRSYVLHIPDTYTGLTPSPLIIDFHALGGSGQNERIVSPYPPVTDAEGVIAAFPTGASIPAFGTAWNIGPCCVDGVDDGAFAREMVRDIAAFACIDPSRIYAVGISMGGGMANYLACESADLFAAVAPSGFDLLEDTIDDCTPSRPITVVSFRGTADPLVPYGGGYSDLILGHPITFLGAVNTFDEWARINGCTGDPSDMGNGCQAFATAQCAGGVEVILCTDQGGGIAPGDPEIAWPVLKRHTLP